MRFMTINEVAQTLSVSRATVNRLIATKQLPVLKVNRSVRIPEQSLNTFIEKNLEWDKKTHKRLSESEFSLEGMFTEGNPIPNEAINEVITEWERE